MKHPEVVEQIKQQLQHVSPDAIVILYGSEARGSSRPDSDIDLLILIDKVQIPMEEEKKIIGVLSRLSLINGIDINPIILPKNQWENRPLITPFYLNIINEGVRL